MVSIVDQIVLCNIRIFRAIIVTGKLVAYSIDTILIDNCAALVDHKLRHIRLPQRDRQQTHYKPKQHWNLHLECPDIDASNEEDIDEEDEGAEEEAAEEDEEAAEDEAEEEVEEEADEVEQDEDEQMDQDDSHKGTENLSTYESSELFSKLPSTVDLLTV